MAVYRFKLTFEDNEEVYREIEIKSTQTFENFHDVIIQSISFDNQHNASFYISDDYWRKGEEIVLRHETEGKNHKKKEGDVPKKLMNKCKMATLIDDPHQKFLYVYDLKTAWSFLIELLKIVPDDAKATYPRVAKSVGDAPKQYKPSDVAAIVLEEEEFDEEEPHIDDVAYENAHSEDETALLESEEGEEMAQEEELADVEEDEVDASEFDAGEHFEED